jgi:hypothetical protein
MQYASSGGAHLDAMETVSQASQDLSEIGAAFRVIGNFEMAERLLAMAGRLRAAHYAAQSAHEDLAYAFNSRE